MYPNGLFVNYFTDAATRGSIKNGAVSELHNNAGDVMWRNPVTHVAENIGKAEIHRLPVEPKADCDNEQQR